MESHDEDPRARAGDDPWSDATRQFTSIGNKLRDRYRELVGDEGPDEDDVREAFRTIGTAAQSVVDSLGDSMRDPAVREQLKEASSTFFSAIGSTLSQLGDELRSTDSPQPEPPETPEQP